MCGVNHKAFARPGYLIDVKAESIAAGGALFTRLLAHWQDLGLDVGQITGLLDLSREYHTKQVDLRIRMALLGEQVEHKRGRLTPDTLDARKAALYERAELFHADETLFFDYAARGHELLTDIQLDRVDEIYHAEKDDGLSLLAGALANAVGPAFTFTRVPS